MSVRQARKGAKKASGLAVGAVCLPLGHAGGVKTRLSD